jgi:hypothetical protein
MDEKLTSDKAKDLIEIAIGSFPHEACSTCECFLGYMAQMRVDGDEQVIQLIVNLQPERSQQHTCLGCNPCPPGDLFATYQREKFNRTQFEQVQNGVTLDEKGIPRQDEVNQAAVEAVTIKIRLEE